MVGCPPLENIFVLGFASVYNGSSGRQSTTCMSILKDIIFLYWHLKALMRLIHKVSSLATILDAPQPSILVVAIQQGTKFVFCHAVKPILSLQTKKRSSQQIQMKISVKIINGRQDWQREDNHLSSLILQ